MTSARRSRSITSGETKPPPLPRTSTISAFLADLREVELGEFIQSRLSHVGNMDIADLAVRLLVNVIDVVLHPIEVIERRFIGDRDDSHISRARRPSVWN